MNEKQAYFLMMKQWSEQIKALNIEQRGELLTAIYQYQCFDEDFTTDDAALKMLWISIKQAFDYNAQKYEKMCEQNRNNAKKRWKVGTENLDINIP